MCVCVCVCVCERERVSLSFLDGIRARSTERARADERGEERERGRERERRVPEGWREGERERDPISLFKKQSWRQVGLHTQPKVRSLQFTLPYPYASPPASCLPLPDSNVIYTVYGGAQPPISQPSNSTNHNLLSPVSKGLRGEPTNTGDWSADKRVVTL